MLWQECDIISFIYNPIDFLHTACLFPCFFALLLYPLPHEVFSNFWFSLIRGLEIMQFLITWYKFLWLYYLDSRPNVLGFYFVSVHFSPSGCLSLNFSGTHPKVIFHRRVQSFLHAWNAFELLPQNNIEMVARVYVKNDVCVCVVCACMCICLWYILLLLCIWEDRRGCWMFWLSLSLILSDRVSHWAGGWATGQAPSILPSPVSTAVGFRNTWSWQP